MKNNYPQEFKDELNSREVLIWSDRTNGHNQEFYAFSHTRIFIKKYGEKEKYNLKTLNIEEIPNIVLEENYDIGTIKFGGSDEMRENTLVWAGKATAIPKFDSIKNAKEVYMTILKLQYGIYDE